jgi:hypothetical protein
MTDPIPIKDARFDPENRLFVITAENGMVLPFKLGLLAGCIAACIRQARNVALSEAAAIARANTTAPRIWRKGGWVAPAAEEIAEAIEALKVQP